MRLAGKTAMITGASRNIGKQVALTFAREGADLLLNTRVSVSRTWTTSPLPAGLWA